MQPCWILSCAHAVHSGLFMHADVVYQNCLTLLPQPVSVCLNQLLCRGVLPAVRLSVGLCLICPYERASTSLTVPATVCRCALALGAVKDIVAFQTAALNVSYGPAPSLLSGPGSTCAYLHFPPFPLFYPMNV